MEQTTIEFYMMLAALIVPLLLSLWMFSAYMKMKAKIVSMQHYFDRQARMTNTGVLAMGRRVLELEERLHILNQQQDDVNEGHQEFAYTKARSLLEQGLSDEVVSTSSGLSLSEVNLMKLVHGGARNARFSSP